jgi:hypothetical protein
MFSRCHFFIPFCCLLLAACNESHLDQHTPYADGRTLESLDALSDTQPDIYIIDFTMPDAYVDPCISATSSSENFCECQPQCCQVQQWYCPPSGLGVNALDVVMNICDDDLRPCDRSSNPNCPPHEIIHQGSCRSVLECPPNLNNDIIITVRCEIEGVEGTQRIICSKGDIEYGECITCTPSEERCNFTDDDCDGEIDENQRNICDSCGPVPADTCDGSDNDCDGLLDENLARECQTVCGRGLEVCQAGNWISCTAAQPSDEECDGADNDCDGRVDEELECLCTADDVGNLVPCSEPPLLCGQGFKTCECVDPRCTEMRMTECSALCSYLPVPEPPVCDPRRGLIIQEECNNFDEDCDIEIDENLLQACYTGDPDTLLVGVCVPGEAYCLAGIWGGDRDGQFEPNFCLGEITPQQEICDGADNDCDGVVDYGEEIRETDILFVVDWSGSMDDQIGAVKIALNRFATHFAAEEPLQWGLVIGPKQFPGQQDEMLVLVSDIVPFDQFLAAFAALGSEGMDTGSEMLLDAVYLSVRNISATANVDIAGTGWWRNTGSIPEKENFNINWRPQSDRIVIVFSDEEEQSYLRDVNEPEGPRRPITEGVVEDAVRAGINLKVYAFASGGGFGNVPNYWEDIALAGNGRLFDLTSNALSMYNDLMSIIDEACLPRQDQQEAHTLTRHNSYKNVSSMPLARYDYENKICF